MTNIDLSTVSADDLMAALALVLEGKTQATQEDTACTATARSTGKRCTLKAQNNGVCHKHGARPAAPTKVTQATVAHLPAKVTIGFRASGQLARRSAYVIADALGLDGTHTTRASLLKLSREEIEALLAERGIAAEVVPAAKLG